MARIENKLPAYTVGSLQRKSQMEVLLEFIKALLEDNNPKDKLKEVAKDVGCCMSALLLVLIDLAQVPVKVFTSIASLSSNDPNVLLSPRFRMLSHPRTGFDTMIRSRASHTDRSQRSKEWTLFC